MIPPLSSRVPAQIDQLVELIRAAVPAGVRVFDCEPVDKPDESDFVLIAPSTPNDPGVAVTYTARQGLAPSYVETSEIVCALSTWNGDSHEANWKVLRDRAQAIFAAIQEALVENQVVEDCWDAVGLGDNSQWHPVPSASGASVTVGFTIMCRSLI